MLRFVYIFLLIISFSFACWGSRPLGMGGAFVAVADDVNAVYWNPAGLGKIVGGQCTAVKNIGGINDTNYDLYLASSVYDAKNQYGYAGAYVSDTTELASVIGVDVSADRTVIGKFELQTTYLQLAAGKKLECIPGGFYYGLGIKQIFYTYALRYNVPQYNQIMEDDKVIEMDVGILYDFGPDISTQNKLFSIGVLGQNILDTKSEKLDIDNVTNLRPGLAIRPDPTWTIAAEWYYLNGDETKYHEANDLRIGIEKLLFDNHLALRYGQYHTNNNYMRAFTYGLAFTWFDLSLEYTCMDWAKNNPHEDTRTLMFGLSYKMENIAHW
jgi:hypothetical protein